MHPCLTLTHLPNEDQRRNVKERSPLAARARCREVVYTGKLLFKRAARLKAFAHCRRRSWNQTIFETSESRPRAWDQSHTRLHMMLMKVLGAFLVAPLMTADVQTCVF